MKDKDSKDNKVLMITYPFPPAGYVGGFRTLKYCKYLGDHGWTPLVLTIKATWVAFKVESLCRQIPDHVRVYRTLDIDPAKWMPTFSRWKATLLRWVAPRSRVTIISPEVSSTTGTADGQARYRARGAGKRLKEMIETILLHSPDSHIFWVPVAYLKGVIILLTEKVDIIYCSSPPHSSHIAAFLLAKSFRKPYVLDFRDPWRAGIKNRWLSKLESATRRLVVRKAANVISATIGERDKFRDEFSSLREDHFTFITNGYDPTDFSDLNIDSKVTPKLTLTHAGTIYSGIGREFFEALHRLLMNYPGIADRIQVNLLGETADEYLETVRELEASGILRTYGMQPHDATLRVLFESDVLVIIRGGDLFSSSHIAAKVFEYLYIQKPILAITKEGELAEIVKKSGLGIVVPPNSVERLTQTLVELCDDYAAGRLAKVPNQDYIRTFERTALTEKLAMILDEVKGAPNV